MLVASWKIHVVRLFWFISTSDEERLPLDGFSKTSESHNSTQRMARRENQVPFSTLTSHAERTDTLWCCGQKVQL
jgi:hypothetical protein